MQERGDQALTQIGSDTEDNRVDCSSRYLLDQIADKWSVLILTALCKEPLRFNELKRCLDGITQKALTQALRRLERNGIVARRVIPSSQIAVEYSITPLGRTLEEPFRALYLWTINHLPTVIQAQSAFDEREVEAL
ncbi:helix-turn-helix domain-containing protein [Pseudomonas sp.]|uniref:winged helix-turn-helix transcriptional regulator n=1 Tax=Pseudomonas sp. TaxID=306 RepID=UPI00299D97C3|nr:helix-turn-helix domain-containing protein [Pseudomonas sp.]MDX1369060.1 helix-turn-helix domain-containing protein [Pseudomonas sp.]MDX1725712.1 helix-turn-helix domain-containing protein [Pseudomonas sp.]